MVAEAIVHVRAVTASNTLGMVVDVGCGKLRHFHSLRQYADELVLVDTRAQIDAVHTDGDLKYTIASFVNAHQGRKHRLRVVAADQFETTLLAADVAFSVATFDIVPGRLRGRMLRAIARNLRTDGFFILIVPRNDSTILRRCGPRNRRWDGHWFANRNGFTFYRNFRGTRALVRSVQASGMILEADLSRYRQVCLIFRYRAGNSRG